MNIKLLIIAIICVGSIVKASSITIDEKTLIATPTPTNNFLVVEFNQSIGSNCCYNGYSTYTLSLKHFVGMNTFSVMSNYFISNDLGPYSYYWSDGFSVVNTTDTIISNPNMLKPPFTVTITSCCSSYTYTYQYLPCNSMWDYYRVYNFDYEVNNAFCDSLKGSLTINSLQYSFTSESQEHLNGTIHQSIPSNNYFLMEGPIIVLSNTSIPTTLNNISVGTHTFTLIDNNFNNMGPGVGCGIDFVVNIEKIDTGKIYLPNAFSPNNDGNNDVFCIQEGKDCIGEFDSFDFKIFNRWGEKVFETKDPSFCWDGMINGKSLDPAIYVYYVKSTFTNGQKIEKKGNVTLIR